MYQRLMDKVFRNQIGWNIEVYVDGILIKTRVTEHIIKNIKETFYTLRAYRLNLNPSKCTIGVQIKIFFWIYDHPKR